jgi:hypothetical protein
MASNKLPSWANWKAKNWLGDIYCFEFIPIADLENGIWNAADPENEKVELLKKGDGHLHENWHKSLTRVAA